MLLWIPPFTTFLLYYFLLFDFLHTICAISLRDFKLLLLYSFLRCFFCLLLCWFRCSQYKVLWLSSNFSFLILICSFFSLALSRFSFLMIPLCYFIALNSLNLLNCHVEKGSIKHNQIRLYIRHITLPSLFVCNSLTIQAHMAHFPDAVLTGFEQVLMEMRKKGLQVLNCLVLVTCRCCGCLLVGGFVGCMIVIWSNICDIFRLPR